MRTGGVPAKLVRQFRGGRGPRAVERWCRHDSWRTFVYSLHVHMCFLPLCTSAKSAQPTAAFCKSNHPRSCNVLPSLTHCFPKGACVALHSTLPSSSSSRPAHLEDRARPVVDLPVARVPRPVLRALFNHGNQKHQGKGAERRPRAQRAAGEGGGTRRSVCGKGLRKRGAAHDSKTVGKNVPISMRTEMPRK